MIIHDQIATIGDSVTKTSYLSTDSIPQISKETVLEIFRNKEESKYSSNSVLDCSLTNKQ